MNIAEPLWFFALIIPLGMITVYIMRPEDRAEIKFRQARIEKLVKHEYREWLRHASAVVMTGIMTVGVLLVAGFETPATSKTTPSDTVQANICFLIWDNSASMQRSNEVGGPTRNQGAVDNFEQAIEGSNCQRSGLVSFDSLSDTLIAPNAGEPKELDKVLDQVRNLKASGSGTAIGVGIDVGLQQCRVGEFGPCNFLLVTDLGERSDAEDTELMEAIESIEVLGAVLHVYDVGADRGYNEAGASFPTPQTTAFKSGAEEGNIVFVDDISEALTNVRTQSFYIPGATLTVPANTPFLPRVFGLLMLLLAIIPFVRTIKQ